jgi:hypothetical protein
VATINEVQLTLEFSTNAQDPTPRYGAPKKPRTGKSGFPSNDRQPVPEPLFTSLWPPQSVASPWHEEDNVHLPRPEEMRPSVPLQPEYVSQAPLEILNRAPRKRSAEVSESVATESTFFLRPRLEHMVLLADVALRNLVAKKPLRMPQGMMLAGITPELRLSEVAPSLWSPGYLTVC